MLRKIVFTLLSGFWGFSSEGFAAPNCAQMAQQAAQTECLNLCPTACMEPLNRDRNESEDDCKAACIDLCTIKQSDEITDTTPWIKAETLRDYKQRKDACEGKPADASPKAWSSVNPTRTDATLP